MAATATTTTTARMPTLESVLDNRSTDCFREFQAFLHQTFCNENLAFWIAVHQYQAEYPGDGDENACHAIVHAHIRSNSIQEINIPCEMRQDILHQVYHHHNYRHDVFSQAVTSILELMRANSYIPFIQQKQQQQQQQQQRHFSLNDDDDDDDDDYYKDDQQQRQRKALSTALTTSVSCPSIASSSAASFSSPSVLHRIKRTLLLSNVVTKKRPYASMPSTPRTSGESVRRSWSSWRKRL